MYGLAQTVNKLNNLSYSLVVFNLSLFTLKNLYQTMALSDREISSSRRKPLKCVYKGPSRLIPEVMEETSVQT